MFQENREQKRPYIFVMGLGLGGIEKRHPDALYTIYEDGNGRFYHTDGKTCWVKPALR